MAEQSQLDYRDPEWLAEKLGVDKSTIYRYLQDGSLPGLQLGRKWLVSERQVVEFLNQETERQTEERRKASGVKPTRVLLTRTGPGTITMTSFPWSHGGKSFEKFSKNALIAFALAQHEAGRLGSKVVSPRDLLLGLINAPESSALKVLSALDVDTERLRERLLEHVEKGEAPETPGALLPGTQSAIVFAAAEAEGVGVEYIGTEHLLLGLLREPWGPPSVFLRELGASLESARAEAVRVVRERKEE